MIRSGRHRHGYGGSESIAVFRAAFKAWEVLRVMSRDACAVFGQSGTDGAGQGAGIFVFEDYGPRACRGAEILCDPGIGVAMIIGCLDIVMPSRQGRTRHQRGRVQDARIKTLTRCGYINAHGTGTMANDKDPECAARSGCLWGPIGQADNQLSTKSMHGIDRVAPAAVELLACIMALRDGVIAPDHRLRRTRPDLCAGRCCPNIARDAPGYCALSNAFGLWRQNAGAACAQSGTRENTQTRRIKKAASVQRRLCNFRWPDDQPKTLLVFNKWDLSKLGCELRQADKASSTLLVGATRAQS